jgi:hypothetical protein
MKSIKRNMKTCMYLFALAAICLAMVSHGYAQDSASINIVGLPEGDVNVVVRNISNNQPAAGGLITWSNVRAGETKWKLANQYIEISHSGLPQFWGMQIYTDNKNQAAQPRYTGTANPAGLVKTDNTIMAIPMAWRITDSVISNPADPEKRSDGMGFSDWLWHFLKDRHTADDPNTVVNEAFQDGDDYATFWNQAGIAWNEAGRSSNPKKAYIYLAADFTMSPVGAVYRTSALTLEAYRGISPFPIYLYKDAPLTEFPNEPGATLENHFSPSGWINYAGQFQVNARSKEVSPYSGTHCFKIHWDGSQGQDTGKWGGIAWLEPSNIWDYSGNSPTHKGYDLRGADYLSFWAKTNSANTGLQIKTYFGNTWDSCGQTPPTWRAPITTQWQQYIISASGRDLSNVTGGFFLIFDAEHDPNPDGCVIYLDDIKFDRY